MTQRLKEGTQLLLATHNKGKLAEVQAMLAPFHVSVISAGDLNLDEPEETGTTFSENALLKAHAAAKASGLAALADDSGLCVEALNDAPGIYSARWAGEQKDFTAAMQRIENELKEKSLKTSPAHFMCVLALGFPDGTSQVFEGRVDGALTFPPRGENGFGYDPIFIATGATRTFAEMDMAEKKKFSHRARAFAALAKSVLPGEVAA
ncbi:MAG: RdgB/HAM1 family non-canonical purine NTP pyrophosphatase [Pseudomonadota bacterium]